MIHPYDFFDVGNRSLIVNLPAPVHAALKDLARASGSSMARLVRAQVMKDPALQAALANKTSQTAR